MENRLYLMSIVCVVIGVAFTLFAASQSRSHYVWDELDYMKTARQLRDQGLNRPYLRAVFGSVGPVFALIHALLSPWTEFLERRTRLVSVLFLIGTLLAGVWGLRSVGSQRPLSALELLGLPILPLMGGLAMTDIFAIGFSFLYIALLSSGIYKAQRARAYTIFAAAVACGLACATRQPSLGLVGALPLLWISYPEYKRYIVMIFVIATVFPVYLFLVWGGIVPPHNASLVGFAWQHWVLSFGQAGLFFVLFFPRRLFRNGAQFVFALAVGFVLFHFLRAYFHPDLTEYLPIKTTTRRYLPIWLSQLYEPAACSLVLSFVIPFFSRVIRALFSTDGLYRYLYGSAFLMLLSTGVFSYTFSSRYPGMAFTLVFLAESIKPEFLTFGKLLRLGLGGSLGIAVLFRYLRVSLI